MTVTCLTSHKFANFPLILFLALGSNCLPTFAADEPFGPEKPVVIKTPFSVSEKNDDNPGADSLTPIEITPGQTLTRRPLISRMIQSRLYLPERMVLGRVAEFTVKGKPGKWVALAMADKDAGSKPILGHNLKLGSDRKVVATIQIPATGLATIMVECPVEGDLVGQFLYFEAAVWSDEKMSDLEIAQCVSTESKAAGFNGVMIQPQYEAKKGVRIIPTTVGPFTKNGQTAGLSSPQP